jgi:hypothetical protein
MPGYPPARVFVHVNNATPSFTTLQLDFEIALDYGRPLRDSLAGFGSTYDEAVASGFTRFVSYSLHPLLCALYDYPLDEHIEFAEWDVQGSTWEVFKGSFGGMHVPGPDTVEKLDPTQIVPADFNPFIEDQIKSRMQDGDMHWVRFFYAQQDRQCVSSEVMWDNKLWTESQDRMRRLAWQKLSGFFSVRSFTFVRRKGAAKQTGIGENAREIERALAALLDLCGKNPQVSDDAIYDHLIGMGFAPQFVDRVIVFGPMCFSRVLLGEHAPSDYRIYRDRGPMPSRRLIDEPVFDVGWPYAMEVSGEEEKREAFMAVAARCSMMKAASQALNDGAKLEDLRFSPTIVMLAHLNDIPEVPGAGESPSPKKPWWQVW